ncbi:hypothetical protein EVAR_90149_1 [Eumeta japonica]|uniref:Uncharacterized protein n=1 Tax=Eumeta variegata TaxID=151549 RepID=A0A4C1Z5L3_EUMVA|nr:hypothetical protein EVAR_90149_1 [Eumeta japonica]
MTKNFAQYDQIVQFSGKYKNGAIVGKSGEAMSGKWKLCTRRTPHNLTKAQKRCKDLPVARLVRLVKILSSASQRERKFSEVRSEDFQWYIDAEEAVTPYEKAVETTTKFKWAKCFSQ